MAALALLFLLLVLTTEQQLASAYLSAVPNLIPPKTVHVAIVVDSINGTLGLNLPARDQHCWQNTSSGCERRRRLLTALTSFAGVLLRQGSSEGLLLPNNLDQLRYLTRLMAVRPGLAVITHANETVWAVIASIQQQQQQGPGQPPLPLQYVQYDVAKNHDSLAAARMATSRLNATMLDASLIAEAEAMGWIAAPSVTIENVTWTADVRQMTAQRVLDEWIAFMPEGDLGLEQFTEPPDIYQFQSDVASAFPLTSWGPDHRLPRNGMPALADKYLQSMAPDALLFGNCHNRGNMESVMVRNTSLQSKILTVSEGDSNVPFYSSFRTDNVSALKQRNTNRGESLPSNKHYVSFQLTDGDALDYTLAGNEPSKLAFWADPNRGKFPIGWSASGQMRDLIQPLLEGFYAEATPFDEHFMMDGYGYGAPSLMSKAARELDAQKTLGAASDLNMSMVAMFSIDGDIAWEEIQQKWAPYAAGNLPLIEFWRQDQGSECYVSENLTQRGAIQWIGETPVIQPRAALWSGPKLTGSKGSTPPACLGLNRTRPTPPCPEAWWEDNGACFQGCPSESTQRDHTSQRCYCDDAQGDKCLPHLTCMSIPGKDEKQCVNCGPVGTSSCMSIPGLVNFLNEQPVDPSSSKGYSVVPVHVWAYDITQLAEVVKQLDEKIEVVTPSELAYLIRKNVIRSSPKTIKDANVAAE